MNGQPIEGRPVNVSQATAPSERSRGDGYGGGRGGYDDRGGYGGYARGGPGDYGGGGYGRPSQRPRGVKIRITGIPPGFTWRCADASSAALRPLQPARCVSSAAAALLLQRRRRACGLQMQRLRRTPSAFCPFSLSPSRRRSG